MKSFLITLFLAAGLIISGCSDLGTNAPTNQTTNKQLLKLPAQSGTTVESEHSVTKRIGAERGGIIYLHDSYKSEDGNLVTVKAQLKLPAHAFDDSYEDITMTADKEYAAVQFNPSMVFKKALKLNLTFTGLSKDELTNLSEGQISFVYVDQDGNTTLIKNDGITVDVRTGSVSVRNAEIHHFSRYSFAK